MMLFSLLSAALSLLLVGSGADPVVRPDQSARTAVEARLRANTQLSSAKEWRAMGSGVEDLLLAIAQDSQVELSTRGRAVSALGFVSTRLGHLFLERTVKQSAASDDAGEKFLLRKAAVALGWLGGAEAPSLLGPLLQHPDPDVRLDAAIALGLTRSEEALGLLRARFAIEPVPLVRKHIGRQIAGIEHAAEAAKPSRIPAP